MSRTHQGGPFIQTPTDDDVLNLGLGQPSPSLLPLEAIARAATRAFGGGCDRLVLQYGTAFGYAPFREALAAFLTARTRAHVEPDELLITSGTSAALGLLSQSFAAPGQTVVCGDPTYFLAAGIFDSAGLRLRGVPVDDEGLCVDELEDQLDRGLRPAFAYVMPAFHNPCGVSLSVARAVRLVELAEQFDFTIISDEPYSLLHFADAPGMSLIEHDGGRGRVVSVGSFSKILAPGLRLGWVNAAPALLERIGEHGVLRSGGALNPVISRWVHQTIDDGTLAENLATLRATFRSRAAVLAGAITKHAPSLRVSPASGGYFMWAQLPAGVDSAAILDRMRDEFGVGFTPGSRCGVDRDCAHYARLSFSFYDEDELTDAAKRLGDALRALADESR